MRWLLALIVLALAGCLDATPESSLQVASGGMVGPNGAIVEPPLAESMAPAGRMGQCGQDTLACAMAAIGHRAGKRARNEMAGDADRDAVYALLAWHQGGLELAQEGLERAHSPPVRALAEQSIQQQRAQIEHLANWLDQRAVAEGGTPEPIGWLTPQSFPPAADGRATVPPAEGAQDAAEGAQSQSWQ